MEHLTAYDSALMFSNSFKILLDRHMTARLTGNYEDFALLVPAMVNGAFACELFLKSLFKKQIRGHRLYTELYQELDSSIKKEIKTVVIERMKRKKNTVINSDKFEMELINIERVFEEFRYIYETNNTENKVYNIDFIEVLVFSLRGICEQKFGKRPIHN